MTLSWIDDPMPLEPNCSEKDCPSGATMLLTAYAEKGPKASYWCDQHGDRAHSSLLRQGHFMRVTRLDKPCSRCSEPVEHPDGNTLCDRCQTNSDRALARMEAL